MAELAVNRKLGTVQHLFRMMVPRWNDAVHTRVTRVSDANGALRNLQILRWRQRNSHQLVRARGIAPRNAIAGRNTGMPDLESDTMDFTV